jgi:hypothetical protein
MYGCLEAFENMRDVIEQLGLKDSLPVIRKPGWYAMPSIPGIPDEIFENAPWFLKPGMNRTIRYCQNRAQMEASIAQISDTLGDAVRSEIALAHDLHKIPSFIRQATRKRVNGYSSYCDMFWGGYQGASADEIIDELMAGLQTMRGKEGVQATGIAMSNTDLIRRIVERHEAAVDVAMVANAFSLMPEDHGPDNIEFLRFLSERNVSVIIAAPFRGGWLVNPELAEIDQLRKASPAECEWREKFHNYCREYDIHPAVVCIRFVAALGVHSVAPGMADLSFIDINFPTSDGAHNDLPLGEKFVEGLVSQGILHAEIPQDVIERMAS